LTVRGGDGLSDEPDVVPSALVQHDGVPPCFGDFLSQGSALVDNRLAKLGERAMKRRDVVAHRHLELVDEPVRNCVCGA
jgi:hypothetical protein